jgi:hypothetical protein
MSSVQPPSRVVHCAETSAWLNTQDSVDRRGWSVISSIPDVSETGQSVPVWERFFTDMARRLMALVDDDGMMAVFQTDTRGEGLWVDKSAMITAGVAEAGGRIVMRKIICRRPPGTTSTRRAAYTHLLVYKKTPLDPSLPDTVADVIADGGAITWTRGVGVNAARAACEVVRRYATSTHTIVDPFCGEGMILAVANDVGFNAIGVERHRKRAEAARRLQASALREAPAQTVGS